MVNRDAAPLVSRRAMIKTGGIAVGATAVGGVGLFYATQGAAAELTSNVLEEDAPVEFEGDGGDVTDLSLAEETEFDLGWEGFGSDIDSVTFTLSARRDQVGTGNDESEARGNLSSDDGSSQTGILSDSPAVLGAGRNGSELYASGDLVTDFPFAIIEGGGQASGVEGTLTDANIDAGSLSADDDGTTKVNVIEFELEALVEAGEQSVTVSESGTLDVVVGNIDSDADTGGTLSGNGDAE